MHNQLTKHFPLLNINQHPKNSKPTKPTTLPWNVWWLWWLLDVGEKSPCGIPAAENWGWIHRQDDVIFMDCSLGWRFGSWIKQPGTASTAPEKPKSSFLDLSDFTIFRFWGQWKDATKPDDQRKIKLVKWKGAASSSAGCWFGLKLLWPGKQS